jgi:hypothetical protein
MRYLERQVAAMRLGGTLSGDGGDSHGSNSAVYSGIMLTDDDIKKAMVTQQPSEILLRGR